ncbi:hypothetical protein P5673_000302 [Acropora cervicornis]|uniref:Uncharacterized protein n=1 Tax=Acropora cervicornis TaxID=6130 RepID=A0AAD9R6W0_ACRCE|nr:hypothetical protein P5673_000302 [Acropora cervicornis]
MAIANHDPVENAFRHVFVVIFVANSPLACLSVIRRAAYFKHDALETNKFNQIKMLRVYPEVLFDVSSRHKRREMFRRRQIREAGHLLAGVDNCRFVYRTVLRSRSRIVRKFPKTTNLFAFLKTNGFESLI